ncbi:MAG: SDR family oxidoreductase [Alphaproteobacteria bacterium]|nr:SDR family oxidoreductase [Alphaproteobacteria bacterium]
MTVLGDQHVVVIGGSSGMGLAIARAAAAAGARVTIAGRGETKLARAVAQAGSRATYRRLDITDEVAVAAFFEATEAIDHLVVTAHASSAVTGAIDTLANMTVASARTFMETKFWGPFVAAKYGQHKLQPQGSIIFFSGAAGVRKLLPHHAAIGATNGAVEALARQLAREIAPKRVNVIAAGLVRTPAYDGLSAEVRDRMYADYAKTALVGRVGRPEDIAQAALYLMSNTYVTGQVHEIDGGRP